MGEGLIMDGILFYIFIALVFKWQPDLAILILLLIILVNLKRLVNRRK